MDESLEPSLRLPPEKPVGEIVWIAGGEVDECSVSLRFWSDDLVPDDVTDLLGINPTQSYKKGDIFRGKVYDRIRKVGFWVYRVKRCAGVSLEDQINTLFDQLPVDLGVWYKLTTKFDADLFCGLWLKRWNRGLDFSPQTLQRISERGLSLSLDTEGVTKRLKPRK
ncbi:DUF4279 domain-containing protein [Nostoc sp. PCC 7107]|uniref:DUF4279 domain-containing protein n=1 Tax=Nostoc sp. PCC 7107 TaxID=317936 RepID=UPI00029ECE6E|nr:DUF4279 domain-containing protein [Nostoc sp. PCC 7107]AFY42382.1 hypothetical protein Nos7107_1746 [Nostoc sp. PCC 7107]